MRKVLFTLLLLVACGVGLGFYLGWFSLSTSHEAGTGQTGVQLRIDQDKMKSDAQKARQTVAGAVSSSKVQPEGK